MLTRVRNANSAHHESVTMPHSKMKEHIAEILKREGYIADFQITDATVGKTLAWPYPLSPEPTPQTELIFAVECDTLAPPCAKVL